MDTKILNLLGENKAYGIIFTKDFGENKCQALFSPSSLNQICTVLLGCPADDEGTDFKLSPNWRRQRERVTCMQHIKK